MTEVQQASFPLNRSYSLDRNDIYANDIDIYPESYEKFKRTIENVFFKSELLLKCKMEFQRLRQIEMLESKPDAESSAEDINLNLIFTGAIKSGRSSIINMILNSKVMPVNVLGSSCCVKISHPKSNSKQISVGTYDWEGWELDKVNDIEITELPKKIEDMQNKLLRTSFTKGKKLFRRLHVQLPHYFLKNINIYKCSPIDGVYSFDEPFDIIEKNRNSILMHVIDASNGLMEWDRTFLAKIQYKMPQLPIFFMINHVDIQYEILLRDRGIPFGLTPDKGKSDFFESESDHTSTDDAASEKFNLTDQSIIKQQHGLIDKCKKQIMKLGFGLEKNVSIYYSSFSVKEFFKLTKSNDLQRNVNWEMVSKFFEKLNIFLNVWMEKMLITSSLQLKCKINGVVDAILCHIIFPSSVSQDITSDIYMQDIKKADRNIAETFSFVNANIEKHILKVVKEQFKKHENFILQTIPDLSTEDPSEIFHIIKPNLIKSCEEILFGNQNQFNINIEIFKIIEDQFKHLEKSFQKICRAKKILNFTKYIFNLFRVLKITFNCPMIINIPEEIFYGNTKWYKDILRAASRKIRGSAPKPRELVQEMINDVSVVPLIKITLMGLETIQKDIHFFTRKYQEAYKDARSWSIESSDVFRKLVMVDFVIKAIEKSFQNEQSDLNSQNLKRLDSFYGEFYGDMAKDQLMQKSLNIQSFTSLCNAVGDLCFKRICQNNKYVLSHKSTELLQNGMCLISYNKWPYDLYTAIKKNTKWTVDNVYSIMDHLVGAVKCMLPFCHYIQIDLLPENILLRPNSSNYSAVLFPFVDVSNSLKYKMRSDAYRKYEKTLTFVIFQMGMVLSWIITNNIQICSEIYNKPSSQTLEDSTINKIKSNMIDELQPFSFSEICVKYLFHPQECENIDIILRDLKSLLESEKVL